MSRHLEALTYHLGRTISTGESARRRHLEKFAEDAVHALEWADGTFRDVARERVAREVLAELEWLQKSGGHGDEEILAIVRTGVAHETRRRAEIVESSTSHCSNHLKNHMRAAYAALAEWMEDLT